MLKYAFLIPQERGFKGLARLISLSLFVTFHIFVPEASAAAPVIVTTWTIANGAESPPVYLDGTGFASDNDKFDFTVDVGTTGLKYDSAAYIDSTRMRFNFQGIAKTGTITIQATASAFLPMASEASNTISIVVPVPLIAQSITFILPITMKLYDNDITPKATATSGLTVVLTSNTPSVCAIYFFLIHAISAGTCSIMATVNGNLIYSQAIPVTRSFLVLANNPVTPLEPTNPTEVVTNLGTLSHDPKKPSGGYISVLVANESADPKDATLIKMLIPAKTTEVPVVFYFSAYSTDEETAEGYFVVRIISTTSDGTPIARLKKIIEINVPAGAPGSLPSWSFDGFTWYKLKALVTRKLPSDLHAGYFVEKDGRVAIMSDYLMLFGFKKSQVPFKISTTALSMTHGSQVQILANGGSGAGAVTFISRTLDVCTISGSGVVSGVMVGKCFIYARKASQGIYSNALASALTIYVQHKSVGR